MTALTAILLIYLALYLPACVIVLAFLAMGGDRDER